MKKKILYKISDNVELKERNKIFLNGFHLFTCNNDALLVIQSIQKKSFVSIEEIKKKISNRCDINKIDNFDEFIFHVLEYLLRCNVLEHIHPTEEDNNE
ncbi:MAG: hypothetical protein KAT74_05365 [Candidatus Cloacimonetes bacterium]|jgi:hypothetical protein|nr:hypothetical protein [Candidatus Cloacimonadota bacterium]